MRRPTPIRGSTTHASTTTVPGLVASVGLLGVLLALLLAPVQTAALALAAIAVATGTAAIRTALDARRQRRAAATRRRVCLPGTDVCIDR